MPLTSTETGYNHFLTTPSDLPIHYHHNIKLTSLSINTKVRRRVDTRTYIYIYIYMYTHTHTHTHIYIYIYIYIQGVSQLQGITAGGDFLGICDQKSSYKHVSDFGRLQSYDHFNSEQKVTITDNKLNKIINQHNTCCI